MSSLEDRRIVEDELRKLRDIVDNTSTDDLKGGGWFVKLLKYSLGTYTKTVDADFFIKKYPGLPRDLVVERRIDLAKRYSAIAGGLSAGAYSAAVAATIGTGGAASPLALPAAVASFASDLFFTTQLQLRLAFDLSVLYDHPINTEDPEDLFDLIRVAFGVKAGETLNNAVTKLSPEAARLGVKAIASGSRLAFLQSLPLIGKYLLQRNIIKFAIPVVSIPLSMGLNYWSTGSIGRTARQIYRGRAALREAAMDVFEASPDHGEVVLKVVLLAVNADGNVSADEASFLHSLLQQYSGDENQSWREDFERILNQDEATVLAAVRAIPSDEAQGLVYQAAVAAIAVDAKVHRNELGFLERLAPACGVEFVASHVRDEAKKYQ